MNDGRDAPSPRLGPLGRRARRISAGRSEPFERTFIGVVRSPRVLAPVP